MGQIPRSTERILVFFTEFGIQNQWSPNLQNNNRSLSMSFEVTAGLFLSIMGPNGRFSLCGIPQLLRQVYNGVTSAKFRRLQRRSQGSGFTPVRLNFMPERSNILGRQYRVVCPVIADFVLKIPKFLLQWQQ